MRLCPRPSEMPAPTARATFRAKILRVSCRTPTWTRSWASCLHCSAPAMRPMAGADDGARPQRLSTMKPARIGTAVAVATAGTSRTSAVRAPCTGPPAACAACAGAAPVRRPRCGPLPGAPRRRSDAPAALTGPCRAAASSSAAAAVPASGHWQRRRSGRRMPRRQRVLRQP